MKVKVSRKYTLKFQKMAFGGEADGEVLEVESFYDENGNITIQMNSDEEGNLVEKSVFQYDAHNRIIRHELHMLMDDVHEILVYERDDKGRVLSETKMYGDDMGEQTLYTYGEHESPVSIQRFDSDGEPESFEELTYNASGYPVEHLKFGPDKNLAEKTIISYNEKNKPVERLLTNSKGDLIKTTLIVYDEKGQLTRVTEKNEAGKVISDILSFYDERGNVIERKVKDFHSRTIRFKFDEHDNCIEEEMLDENGNMTMKSIYEFDENNLVISESGYFTDMNRSSSMANSNSRYEYEFYE